MTQLKYQTDEEILMESSFIHDKIIWINNTFPKIKVEKISFTGLEHSGKERLSLSLFDLSNPQGHAQVSCTNTHAHIHKHTHTFTFCPHNREYLNHTHTHTQIEFYNENEAKSHADESCNNHCLLFKCYARIYRQMGNKQRCVRSCECVYEYLD